MGALRLEPVPADEFPAYCNKRRKYKNLSKIEFRKIQERMTRRLK